VSAPAPRLPLLGEGLHAAAWIEPAGESVNGPPSQPLPQTTYLATCLPGLEPVVADELQAKVAGVRVAAAEHGRVIITSITAADTSGPSRAPTLHPEALLALRSIDNLYLILGQVPVGAHRADLDALAAALAGLPAGPERPDWTVRAPARPLVYVNASRRGHHTYSRFEAAEAALRGLRRRHPRWQPGTPERHDLEFRLDVEHETATLSLRLTDASFRFRGRRHFAPAALRPPVAHALVWLAGVSAGDVFLDPFCGSGTIVAERAAYAARRLLGSDISDAALAAARQNLSLQPNVQLVRADARRLPFAAGSVDAVATNLPFGRQVLARSEIGRLYAAFARQLARVLAPAGRAIVLTDQIEALSAAVEETGLRGEPLLSLSLKGRHPQVWRLAR